MLTHWGVWGVIGVLRPALWAMTSYRLCPITTLVSRQLQLTSTLVEVLTMC